MYETRIEERETEVKELRAEVEELKADNARLNAYFKKSVEELLKQASLDSTSYSYVCYIHLNSPPPSSLRHIHMPFTRSLIKRGSKLARKASLDPGTRFGIHSHQTSKSRTTSRGSANCQMEPPSSSLELPCFKFVGKET